MISIWLNVGAMKLQYYEEVIKQSTSGEAISTVEERAEEEADQNAPTTSSGVEDTSDENTSPPPSLTPHELKVLIIVMIWMVILSVTSLFPIGKDDIKFTIGVAVNLNLIFFYAAPLSTIVEVFRTKSSSSIHFWTMVMNTSNAFFWCIYSFAIQDYYILIPNGLGFSFGIIQIVLCGTYSHNNVVDGDGTEQFLGEDNKSKGEGSETEII